MVEFFADMSHGKLDLSGTKVFGWFRLPATRDSYVGNVYPQPAGKLNRSGLLDLALAAAGARGVQLSNFAGVCVSGYGSVDLCGWVGGMAALCDSNTLQPSLLGQEMGHGYGLDHARQEGSTADYQDPWDVMSTAVWPSMEADDADYVKVGPGLNAWNMRARGWLDESRVWAGDLETVLGVAVELRPLHHHHLPGYLAAELGPYLVEFRVREKWDAAIPRACVLVHRFASNRSYLETAVSGAQDLVAGDSFVSGSPDSSTSNYYEVEVNKIDESNKTATIRLRHHPKLPFPREPGLADLVLGGIDVDGGGVLVVGGRIIKVPPRGPERALVEQVARYLATDVSGDVASALALRRSALAEIVRSAIALHAEAEIVSEQPPGYKAEQEG